MVLLCLVIATTMQSLSILAVVVTLGIAPMGAGVCRAFCAGDDVAQECHDTLASVVAADCCDGPATSINAVARAESRPLGLPSAPNAAALQRSIEVAATSTRLIRNKPHGLHANSLATVLRI